MIRPEVSCPNLAAAKQKTDIFVSALVRKSFVFNRKEEIENHLKNADLPNWVDQEGCTPMHWASLSETPSELMQKLVDRLVMVNKPDQSGDTPLHLSCMHHKVEAIAFLLDHGASLFQKNSAGRLPIQECKALPNDISGILKLFMDAIKKRVDISDDDLKLFCIEVGELIIQEKVTVQSVIDGVGNSPRIIQCFGTILRDPSFDAPAFLMHLPISLLGPFVEGLKEDTGKRIERWNVQATIQFLERQISACREPERAAALKTICQHLSVPPPQIKTEQSHKVDPLLYHTYCQDVKTPMGRFSWEDCEDLISFPMALRHVSSLSTAQYQVKNGTNGDALSLHSGFCFLLLKLAQEGKLELGALSSYLKDGQEKESLKSHEMKVDDLILAVMFLKKHFCSLSFTLKDKEVIRHAFEHAVQCFIFNSLFTEDSSIDDSNVNWFSTWITGMQRRTSFILIHEQNSKIARDQKHYCGLGKIGTGIILPEDIISYFTVPTVEKIQTLTEGSDHVTVKVGLVYHGLMQHCMNSLLNEIRTYKRTQLTPGAPGTVTAP